MPKKLNLDEYIKKILDKGPQSIGNIINLAKEDSEFRAPIKNESYYEAIHKLFKSGSIRIEGYQVPDRKRQQKIENSNLILSIVKTKPLDIKKLIRDLEDDDVDKAKETYDELIDLFKKKFRQINLDSLRLEIPTTDTELNNLFEDILFYINSQVPKDPYIHKFSRALSDDEQSMKLLKELISESKSKSPFLTDNF